MNDSRAFEDPRSVEKQSGHIDYDDKADIEIGETCITDLTELDPATDKRLLRKIDLYICPVMMLVYAVQFMDKQTNSTASVMGLRQDLHMEGNDYSWSGTSFYLGYLAFEFPASTFSNDYR